MPFTPNLNAPLPTASKLLVDNERWASSIDRIEPSYHETLASGQKPKVLWLGCSDSRVPESVISFARPGDMFVHRTIANQFPLADDNFHSVLEFAIKYVGNGSVEDVVVVGHTSCGGIDTCLNSFLQNHRRPVPSSPPDSRLNKWLGPLYELTHTMRPSEATPAWRLKIAEASVKKQVEAIAGSEIIRNVWQDPARDVKIHGWIHEIEKGRLRDLRVTVARPDRR